MVSFKLRTRLNTKCIEWLLKVLVACVSFNLYFILRFDSVFIINEIAAAQTSLLTGIVFVWYLDIKCL